ncbi:hypothetical protein G9A89_016468 [Geosiphon pyriformis]|nr:hypothetical protein G9A89_016468 [Geosiphon pyriformis]
MLPRAFIHKFASFLFLFTFFPFINPTPIKPLNNVSIHEQELFQKRQEIDTFDLLKNPEEVILASLNNPDSLSAELNDLPETSNNQSIDSQAPLLDTNLSLLNNEFNEFPNTPSEETQTILSLADKAKFSDEVDNQSTISLSEPLNSQLSSSDSGASSPPSFPISEEDFLRNWRFNSSFGSADPEYRKLVQSADLVLFFRKYTLALWDLQCKEKQKNFSLFIEAYFGSVESSVKEQRENLILFPGDPLPKLAGFLENSQYSVQIPYLNEIGVLVHQGLWNRYQQASDRILDEMRIIVQELTDSNKPIRLAGLNIGGAYAIFTALALKLEFPSTQITVFTYSLPRIGNKAFAQLVNQRLSFQERPLVYRFTFFTETLPTLPRFRNYLHPKQEYWVSQVNGPLYECPGINDGELESPGCNNLFARPEKLGENTLQSEKYFGVKFGECETPSNFER